MVDDPTRRGSDGEQVISNYRLGRVLGQGGMGVVYEATNTRNDERVALKLLHAHLEEDETYRDRFQREAHVAALLRSPYTVHLIDYGFEQGRYFLVMKFVEGESLHGLIADGPLEPSRALRIASQIALALEEAEARGVVHCDIKPDNVMFATDGTVQVLDFGIARQTGRATLTATGAFVGTLMYAAPEAAEGRADHRSDLYSLGATLYHMLAGRPPFQGEMIELLRLHRETPMPREPLGGLAPEIVDVVARCLDKDPAARFQTASELAGVLEHLSLDAARRRDRPVQAEATELLKPAGTADTSLITMALEPRGTRRRFIPRASSTRYELVLRNDADEVVGLELDASDPADACAISLARVVALPAHAETTVEIDVAPRRRRWLGERELRPFRVTATGAGGVGGPPVVAVGEFEDRPQGLLTVAGGAIFSLALIGLIAVVFTAGGAKDEAVLAASAAAPGGGVRQQGALEFDEPFDGVLDKSGEIDAWSFTAAAGQIVTMEVIAEEPESFHPYIELLGPDGSLLAFNGDDGEPSLDAVRLPVEGRYTLRIRGSDELDTGAYTVELFDEEGSDPETFLRLGAGGGAVESGARTFATLAPGAVDRWTFTATAGQTIEGFALPYQLRAFDALLELRAADGTLVGFGGESAGEAAWLNAVTLLDDAEYTVTVRGAGAFDGGRYELWLELGRVGAPPAPGVIEVDHTAVGTIDEAGESDSWSFAGSAGQVLSPAVFAYAPDGLDPYVELLGPDGSLLLFVEADSSGAIWIDRLLLPEDGEYALRIRSASGEATGAYRVELWDDSEAGWATAVHPQGAGDAFTLELRAEQMHFATLPAGAEHRWTFDAEAGQAIAAGVEPRPLDPFDLTLELLGPDGAILAAGETNADGSAWTDEVRLLESGEYTVLVRGATAGDGGRYALTLEVEGVDEADSEATSAAPASTPTPAATPTAAPTATPGPSSAGKIVFFSDRNGNSEIHVMNADGTGQTRVATGSGAAWDPAWSPDGTQIAFASDSDGNFEIYVMNADGTEQLRLTTLEARARAPAWSPDGRRIAFASAVLGETSEILVMNADGTGLTRLTTGAWDYSPAWSPDGAKIAFSSDRDGGAQIYVMDPDGGGLTRITSGGSGYASSPAWSPDGTKISFRSVFGNVSNISVINADGTGRAQLTEDSADDYEPDWSPDGARIAFYSDRDGPFEIYVMNADGSGLTRLTNNGARDFSPDWSPAGAR